MKRYLITLILLVCIAFCLAGCRKTKEDAGTQELQAETLPSQEEAAEEEAPEEDTDKKLHYQETIEMDLGEDQEGAASPAE